MANEKPTDPPGPVVKSIWDFATDALQELKTWLEMSGLVVPASHVIGGGTFGGGSSSFTEQVTIAPATDTAALVLQPEAGALLGNTLIELHDPTGTQVGTIDNDGGFGLAYGLVVLNGLTGEMTFTGTGGINTPTLTAAVGISTGVNITPRTSAGIALEVDAWSAGQTEDYIAVVADDGVTRVFRVMGDGGVVVTLPTSDPHVVGQLWNSSGVVQVSAG